MQAQLSFGGWVKGLGLSPPPCRNKGTRLDPLEENGKEAFTRGAPVLSDISWWCPVQGLIQLPSGHKSHN